jgi:hypothetical protein
MRPYHVSPSPSRSVEMIVALSTPHIIRFTCPPSQMQRNSLQNMGCIVCTRRLVIGDVIVRLCLRVVAVFHSTHSRNKINQTKSELKHGHNKVDDAVRKTLILHVQSMRKHGTTAKLSRTFKVRLL